jgi:hypothetical protein
MGLFGVRTWWRLRRLRNPLERDYRLKRAMGFPDEVFTRAARLLRQPATPPPSVPPRRPEARG